MYIIVPAALMIVVAIYVRFRPKEEFRFRVTAESPFAWPRPSPPVGPAVQITTDQSFEWRNAEREADDAIRQGKIRYFHFGAVPPWHQELVEVWLHRFGIEVQTITTPLVSDAQMNYYSAYNSVIDQYIDRYHGWDARLDASREAKRLFDRRGEKTANKAPEPTPGSVTPRATEGTSK